MQDHKGRCELYQAWLTVYLTSGDPAHVPHAIALLNSTRTEMDLAQVCARVYVYMCVCVCACVCVWFPCVVDSVLVIFLSLFLTLSHSHTLSPFLSASLTHTHTPLHQVLRILPETWTVGAVHAFLRRSLHHGIHAARTMHLQRSLSK
jgi:hypothetical protein